MNLYDTTPAPIRVTTAIRELGGPGKGVILGYFPIARLNPYQALLYSRAWENEFAPIGLATLEDLHALEIAVTVGTPALLHIHWTAPVTTRATDADKAERAAVDFLTQLEELRSIGVQILWTVHNVLPHMCRFPDVEISIRKRLAELADWIHVMASDTIAATQNLYALPPEKLIEVPHPSYVDAYPRHYSRRQARFELGYRSSDLVIGTIGSIQPYKGLDVLIDAAERARADNPHLQILIAGLPGRDPQSAALIDALDEVPYIRCLARSLDPNEVALAIRALDAAVLPYKASLNSGAALLALSQGVPIIAPRIGSFTHLVDAGYGLGYEGDPITGLSEAIAQLPEFLQSFDAESALEYCASISGPSVSQQFFEAVSEALRADKPTLASDSSQR